MTEQNRRNFMKTVGAAALAGAVGSRASFAESSNAFDKIPRLSLTTLPTACYKMNNLTELVGGPDLYIKRDRDGTGPRR